MYSYNLHSNMTFKKLIVYATKVQGQKCLQ